MKTKDKVGNLATVFYLGLLGIAAAYFLATRDAEWFIGLILVDIAASLHLMFLQKEEE